MRRAVLLDMIRIVLEMIDEAGPMRAGTRGAAKPTPPAANDDQEVAEADLRDVAARLNRLALSLAQASDPGASEHDPCEPWLAVSEQTVRAVIDVRRLRAHHLGPGLFADPGWDLLLALLVARREGRTLTSTSLAVAAGTQPTTTGRWIEALRRQGLVVCEPDSEDRRRVRVALTEAGAERMDSFLIAALWVSPVLA